MLDAESSKTRELILGIVGTKYTNAGIEYFGNLTIERLERLIEKGFFVVREKEIYSKFLQFMRKNRNFRAYGFAVSPSRSDSRIVIEGIEGTAYKFDESISNEFMKTFNEADSLNISPTFLKCKYNL